MKSLGASFRCAFRGLCLVFATERNMRIHLGVAVIAVALCWYLRLSRGEFLYVLLAIVLVFMAETFNTALEKVVDLVSPQFNPLAGKVKDLAAGAVLLAALHSIIVGIVVFGGHLFQTGAAR